ncbi:hypothetical protein HSRCO_2888 [Halanaeroarchaeum sp. HSR-CO]|uniref:4Fe-4S ferredoxin N-terminal domain-containing protein n=1 Tax=Halanaeroarchaeum sp. HSR-CO TaxID=2866382 RepID=UPI00217E2504|nr:4Fe-4S ferredoxin N-terminal domain-containing protein [Halanaeroarchaeum sp. HSR-CO]UWG46610.1 hypothetical protein HSRCO_2888 [Halanaeroarchaeum sp. HSR-CO]
MTNQHRPVDGPPDADQQYELNRTDATAILADSDHDTDLGLRLARDAIRVANGDLDEATFHDRHHEAVLAEFGVDDRPVPMEGPTDE